MGDRAETVQSSFERRRVSILLRLFAEQSTRALNLSATRKISLQPEKSSPSAGLCWPGGDSTLGRGGGVEAELGTLGATQVATNYTG